MQKEMYQSLSDISYNDYEMPKEILNKNQLRELSEDEVVHALYYGYAKLKDVKYQTELMCKAAVYSHGNKNFKYVENKTEEFLLYAIKYHENLIKDVHNPSEVFLYKALRENPSCLRYIENQTEEMCLYAIRRGASIDCVQNKTEKLIKEAEKYLLKERCSIDIEWE